MFPITADDEQSDFFHEPDTADQMIQWWETKDMMEGIGNREFDEMLTGALSHMPVTSQRSFRRRVDKLIARAEVISILRVV